MDKLIKDNYFINQLANFYSLSSIKTWRNTPASLYINYTELNHIYMKSTIFMILAEFVEKKYGKKINYLNFLNLLIGHSLIRKTFKDINVDLLTGIDKKDIIKFVIEEYKEQNAELSDQDIKKIKLYYSNTMEKYLWELSSTLANQLDFELIKNNPLLLDTLNNDIEEKFYIWKENFISKNNKYFIKEEKEDLINRIGIFNNLFKFIYNSTMQQRWNGIDLTKKITIAEHQILVALTFFKYIELYKEQYLKNNFYIKNNLNNLLFHDSPEIITKDINSPIKRKLNGLREILEKKLENNAMENYFFKQMPSEIEEYFRKLELLEPFKDRKINGIPIHGKLGKAMDDITAYWEAKYNLLLGNKLDYVNYATQNIEKKYKQLAEKNPNSDFSHVLSLIKNIGNNVDTYLININKQETMSNKKDFKEDLKI